MNFLFFHIGYNLPVNHSKKPKNKYMLLLPHTGNNPNPKVQSV